MKYLLLLMLAACVEYAPPIQRTNWEMPMKYCLEECRKATFSSFHNDGGAFSGASSMNGLSQSKIFDRVMKYCEEFYKDEKCCESTPFSDKKTIKSTIHGYFFGACK